MAVWAIAFNENFTVVSNAVFGFLTVDFGWLYLIVMLSFVLFAIIIAFSKWGKIKLGPDDSKPEYSNVSWFAMLFGCGMGVGLVFWGIAEPLSHFAGPMAGVVTSLGLGVLQINAGLNYLFGVPADLLIQIVIILVIAVVFIGSAVLGIEKGISKVSDLNLILAVIIMAVCFIVGPKIDVLSNLVGGLGDYIGTFFQSSLAMTGYADNSWTLGWCIFYWAWWIAWAPFVGLLIAGGLKPLQTISIAAAFPFIFIMIAAMVSVAKGLAHDADTPNVGDPGFVPDPDGAALEAEAAESE